MGSTANQAESVITAILRYPLDLTGESPDNKVEDEEHDIGTTGNYRSFVPKYGPFFTESFKIYDGVTGAPLERNVDYIAAQLEEAATSRTGKEVCSAVIIKNKNVSSTVRITAQVIGGPYILSVTALEQMLANLQLDDRPVTWGAILGKLSFFPPGHHLHDAGDIFGFEYLVLELEEVRKAILMGDVASHDEIYKYIDSLKGSLQELIDQALAELTAHIENTENPHNTTKAQVGLGNVQNYRVATDDDMVAGTSHELYVTPYGVKHLLDALYLTAEQIQNLLDSTVGTLGAAAHMDVGTTPGTVAAGNHTHDRLVNGAGSAVLSSSGDLTTSGDLIAFSDIRLKTDFKEIKDPLEKLMGVVACIYRRTDVEDGELTAGFTAQSVDKVLPEAIRYDDNGYMKVIYNAVHALHVRATQELIKKVNAQEALINEMNLRIQKLEKFSQQ